MFTEEDKLQIEAQVALSKNLGLGVALSLMPIVGLGSLAALVIGLRAQRKIKASGHRLVGSGMASWCVVVGTVGLLVNLYLFGWGMIRR